MEKKMKNEMETRGISGFKELKLRYCFGGNQLDSWIPLQHPPNTTTLGGLVIRGIHERGPEGCWGGHTANKNRSHNECSL